MGLKCTGPLICGFFPVKTQSTVNILSLYDFLYIFFPAYFIIRIIYNIHKLFLLLVWLLVNSRESKVCAGFYLCGVHTPGPSLFRAQLAVYHTLEGIFKLLQFFFLKEFSVHLHSAHLIKFGRERKFQQKADSHRAVYLQHLGEVESVSPWGLDS